MTDVQMNQNGVALDVMQKWSDERKALELWRRLLEQEAFAPWVETAEGIELCFFCQYLRYTPWHAADCIYIAACELLGAECK